MAVTTSSGGTEQAKAALGEKVVADPTQLDLRVFSGSGTATLSIQNATSVPIEELRFSSTGLLDGKTGIRIPSWDWPLKLPAALKPGERVDCEFHLPTSDDAGAYTGILRVYGSGREALVPLTLRMRGPYLPCWPGYPLLFCTAVFLGGWSLSLWLDHWYTKSLPRVQQVLLLREHQEAVARFQRELAAWETRHNTTLARTISTVTFDKSDIDSILTRVNTVEVTVLQQAEQKFDLGCRFNDTFWTALQIAGDTRPTDLPRLALQMDAVPRGADLAVYRTTLLDILARPLPAAAAALVAPGAAPALGVDLSRATSASLHRRVLAMDGVKAGVLAIVVWITAFSLYYYPNPSFGNVLDYLTLFIWSLGLTTTGAQLIGSVKRS